MAKYLYKGRNIHGRLTEGHLEVSNERAVIEHLQRNGIIPINIELAKESFDIGRWFVMHKPIRQEELAIFCRQLHTLLRAGVSITLAIRGLADATSSERLKIILFDLATALEEGRELSVAMQKHHAIFDELFVSLVKVGESSGNLPEVFKRLSEYIEFDIVTKQRVKAATRYPIMVLCSLAVAMAVVTIFVIPAFSKLFAGLKTELPLPTRILLGTSNLVVNGYPLIIFFMIVFYYMVKTYLSTPLGRMNWDRIKLRLPIFGKITERICLSRFSRSFALSYRAGVPMLETLQVVAYSVGNTYLTKKIVEMRQNIEHGESLTQTADKSKMFTPLVLQMINVGEQTGEIDNLLEQVATMYERDVDYDIKKLGDSIEPLLIAFMAALVTLLALGIFLPMWDMSSAFNGGGH